MKKILTCIAALCCALVLSAQDSDKVIASIKASPARTRSIEASFREVRKSVANPKSEVVLQGKIKYEPETKLSMDYDNGDVFSIDGNLMVISKDGKKQEFDISKNMMMKGLSHAILYAFSGRMDDLAKEQHAKMLVSEKDGKYVVTLAAQTQAARGYSCIEVTYDKKSGVLEKMRMDEFTGQAPVIHT